MAKRQRTEMMSGFCAEIEPDQLWTAIDVKARQSANSAKRKKQFFRNNRWWNWDPPPCPRLRLQLFCILLGLCHRACPQSTTAITCTFQRHAPASFILSENV